MSVYTVVEKDELEAFLTNYPLGELLDYQGISAGIENTNYFVNTSEKRLVLTLFENHTQAELGYFLDLMAFLSEHGVPSAHPIADNNGHYLRELNGKPAAFVMRLSGTGVDTPSVTQCRALGHALATMHLAGQSFKGHRDNDRGPHWWHLTRDAIADKLSENERALLDEELTFQRSHRFDNLPRGVIHADLFRDNALFEGDTLTGLIDFYYACNDVLLYDVAVTVNDWCSNDEGELVKEKVLAMLGAYHAVRPFAMEEQQAWPVMLRAGALRFWLSRLQDMYFPREGELTHIKDPEVFRNILLSRKAQQSQLIELFRQA